MLVLHKTKKKNYNKTIKPLKVHKAFNVKAKFYKRKTMPNKWKGDTPIYNNIQPFIFVYHVQVYIHFETDKNLYPASDCYLSNDTIYEKFL